MFLDISGPTRGGSAAAMCGGMNTSFRDSTQFLRSLSPLGRATCAVAIAVALGALTPRPSSADNLRSAAVEVQRTRLAVVLAQRGNEIARSTARATLATHERTFMETLVQSSRSSDPAMRRAAALFAKQVPRNAGGEGGWLLRAWVRGV